MKKKICLILLCGIMLLEVCGCGKNENNQEKLDNVLNNLSNTSKITIEDTMSIEKKIYTIEEQEEINKITNILSNIKTRTDDTNDSSRYKIKLYNKENKEYANLSFYPIKIEGYDGKLTLNESTTDLNELIINNYSVTFPEINNNVKKILKSVTKIEVRNYSDNKLVKTIKDSKKITKINNVILDTKVDVKSGINAIGLKYNLKFLNKKGEEVASIDYDPYLLFSIDGTCYKLIKFDNDALSKLIEK